MVLLLVLAKPASVLFEAPALATLLSIYAITTFLLTPHFQLTFLQQANMDFKGVFWSNIVKQGTLFGFIMALLFFKTPHNAYLARQSSVIYGFTGRHYRLYYCPAICAYGSQD